MIITCLHNTRHAASHVSTSLQLTPLRTPIFLRNFGLTRTLREMVNGTPGGRHGLRTLKEWYGAVPVLPAEWEHCFIAVRWMACRNH